MVHWPRRTEEAKIKACVNKRGKFELWAEAEDALHYKGRPADSTHPLTSCLLINETEYTSTLADSRNVFPATVDP